MKAAIEQLFNGTLPVTTLPSYNPDNINVGSLLGQFNLGANPEDRFVGPRPAVTIRPMETSAAIPATAVHPMQIAPDLFWVFAADGATASSTRRIQLFTYVPSTNVATFNGFVTLTMAATNNHTIRGLRMARDLHTAGTVTVSGTAVTGTGTTWLTDRVAVGSRIGFGSTDPAAITTWYEISAVGTNGSITLTGSAGTIASATAYVIEELRAVLTTTNSVATNGGLFVAKGLRIENFILGGTTISAATTVDNIRAVYWLRDAATVTNTVSAGLAIVPRTSFQQHDVYVLDGAATTARVFRYNIRAALTLTAGAATLTAGTDLTVTGTQTVTGNISQNNNGRVWTANHGPGTGVACLYFVTATRVCRAPLSGITAGSTTFVADSMLEVPPGGTNTFTATATMAAFDGADSFDRIVVATSSGRIYTTQYRTDSGQFEGIGNIAVTQTDQASASAGSFPFLHAPASTVTPFVWMEAGYLFYVLAGTTNVSNFLYILPLGADWNYAATTAQRVIFPRMNLGQAAQRFYRVLVNAAGNLGSSAFGKVCAGFRVYVRTAGINDNSGAWTLVPANGDLSGLGSVSEVQFMTEFQLLTDIMVPARVMNMALVYETPDPLPSQYRWNFGDFNTSNGTFAWVQSTPFGGTLGTHTINILRADTNALVLTQSSSSTTNGTFEFWNGSTWAAGLGFDVIGTRRRFVPTGSLPGGVPLYATISVG